MNKESIENEIKTSLTRALKLVTGQAGIKNRFVSNLPTQIIYFGAPGTGKSYSINRETAKATQGLSREDKNKTVVRTTFHPDSDYASFVGSYKPIMGEPQVRYELNQEKAVPLKYPNGEPITEQNIEYRFVPQAFLQAYTEAWKKLAQAEITEDGINSKPQFLIIEEINRGNCAQIFGDLFQLLDRNEYEFSDYPICPSSEIKRYIKDAFKGIKLDDAVKENINSIYNDHFDDVVGQILEGNLLCLPHNLYIWATMNTSDQSLFPIDSAFKRRWEWRYIKIAKPADKDWELAENVLDNDGNKIKWWAFVQKINVIIDKMTSSADKQLGYFFVKASDNKTITNEQFVSKVCFYLWNDIFKTYATDDLESNLFKFDKQIDETKQPARLTFPDFYKDNGEVATDVVNQFINNVMNYEIK